MRRRTRGAMSSSSDRCQKPAAGAGVWIFAWKDAPPAASAQTAGADAHAGHDMSGATVQDGRVVMDPAMARSLGVVVVEAQLAPVSHSIRTTGSVTYDETRLTTITPKFSGFVEQLHVNFTGQAVRRGQPLLEVYAPELVAAQEELLAALHMAEQMRAGASSDFVARAAGLVDAARRRLLLWDISPAQIQRIEQSVQHGPPTSQ